jgi:hypothetical protein
MKSTPHKIDISAAAKAANALTEATARKERPTDEKSKMISLRLKETDYKMLKGLYGNAGLSLAAGIRMSAFYLASMVEQGAFAITPGGFIDKRR